ncbi:hypothetical protein NA57DRAFT_71564 [Rhizodiscina lignyota]|uniref:Neutral protease 2 n=1 Tax=Rhizodiscina lignyota TaxID=1504668 RepID=A0A9P4IJ81_9PEZI|nr:hypothetical protein NA57DRAFT_71564 [Rhizodiscina lignyota]
MKGFTTIALAALVALGSSAVLDRRASGLSVELTATGNSKVKATVTNDGAEDLNLLSVGTMLDTAESVEKVKVYSAEAKIAFTGIRKRVNIDNLSADAFTPLAAGSSMEFEVDIASVHDLSDGGIYSVLAQGALPYATANSTTLSGAAVPFVSNTLKMDVNGAEAAKVEKAVKVLDKRTIVSSDCSGSEASDLRSALSNCVSLANAAASAATSGSASKFQEYFKSTSSSVRSEVANCLSEVADECSSSTSGSTDYYCEDIYGGCSSDVLAYTVPSQEAIVSCPLYFNDLPILTSTCHAQDMSTTTIHEMTHALCGTLDLGYGYQAATSLSSSQAVDNADSYALYANAIHVGC